VSSKSQFKQNLFLYCTQITTINWLCSVPILPDYLANEETMGLLS